MTKLAPSITVEHARLRLVTSEIDPVIDHSLRPGCRGAVIAPAPPRVWSPRPYPPRTTSGKYTRRVSPVTGAGGSPIWPAGFALTATTGAVRGPWPPPVAGWLPERAPRPCAAPCHLDRQRVRRRTVPVDLDLQRACRRDHAGPGVHPGGGARAHRLVVRTPDIQVRIARERCDRHAQRLPGYHCLPVDPHLAGRDLVAGGDQVDLVLGRMGGDVAGPVRSPHLEISGPGPGASVQVEGLGAGEPGNSCTATQPAAACA